MSDNWEPVPENEMPYDEHIQTASNETGIKPEIIREIIHHESRFNPNAQSPTGPKGLMQLSKDAAIQAGINPDNRFNPAENIKGGTRYYKMMQDQFGPHMAYAAYHDGPDVAKNVVEGRGQFSKPALDIQKKISEVHNATDDSGWEPVPEEPVKNEVKPEIAPVENTKNGRNWSLLGDTKNISPAIDILKNAVYGIAGRGEETLAGLTEPLLSDKYKEKIARQHEWLKSAPGADAGGTISDIVSGIPAMIAAPEIASSILGSAGIGALQEYLTRPGNIDERLSNAKMGALGGFIGQAVPNTLSKLIGGFKPSVDASKLMAQGVVPTVGQGSEQAGIIKPTIRKLEEASTSLPFIGSITRNARERAKTELRNLTYSKAEIPGVISAKGKTGYEGNEEIYNDFKKAYKDELSGHSIPLKPQLYSDVHNIIGDTTRFLTPENRDYISNVITNNFKAIPQTGSRFAANDFKNVESNLESHARGFLNSPDMKEREIGRALNDISDVMAKYRSNNLPAEVGKRIKDLDSKYAIYKRIEKASSALGAEDGKFNSSQLLNAVKQMDKSKDKGQFGRGKALLQDLATTGKSVMRDTLSESGTAPRSMLTNALMGAGEAAGTGATVHFAGIPAYLTALGVLGTGSTRPVQKALLGGYKTQSEIAKLLNKTTPLSALFGRSYINNMRDQ